MERKGYIKHKKVIDWFYTQNPINAKEVLFKIHGIWNTTSNPSWDVNTEYVINDKFAEFRKAICDGLVVEYKVLGITDWVKLKNNEFSDEHEYRVIYNKLEIGDSFLHNEKHHVVIDIDCDSYKAEDGNWYQTDIIKYVPNFYEICWCLIEHNLQLCYFIRKNNNEYIFTDIKSVNEYSIKHSNLFEPYFANKSPYMLRRIKDGLL